MHAAAYSFAYSQLPPLRTWYFFLLLQIPLLFLVFLKGEVTSFPWTGSRDFDQWGVEVGQSAFFATHPPFSVKLWRCFL